MVVFLALNTVANLAAPHPVERWVMGSITLLLTGMSLAIALRAPELGWPVSRAGQLHPASRPETSAGGSTPTQDDDEERP